MPSLAKQTGFTLIELVIVIALFSIIAAVASQILAQGFQTFITSQNLLEANWQGQLAMERMTRDLRSVRSANDISVNTSSAFTFVNSAGTSLAYTLSGSNLTLNNNILASGVNNLTFTYYDKTGATVTNPASIAYVKVALIITQNNTNYSVATAVFLRDLIS